MQKKLIALAVAGLVAAPAFAQSNVTIYGVVDAYFGLVNGKTAGDGDTKAVVDGGLLAGSRLGFKGSEDLGNGLKAEFVLEQGFNVDDGTINAGGSQFFQRQAFVALNSSMGKLGLGRQYAPGYGISAEFEATGGAIIAPQSILSNAAKMTITPNSSARWDNSVAYASPNFSGLTVNAIWGVGTENQSAEKDGRRFGLGVKYANGPIGVAYVYHKAYGTPNDKANPVIPAGVGNSSQNEHYLGGSYDFGMFKLVGSYQTVGGDTGDAGVPAKADAKLWQLGGVVPVGAGNVHVVYGKLDSDASQSDAKSFALAYTQGLSKRTTVYAGLNRTSNDDNVAYGLGGTTYPYDNGEAQTIYAVGVNHKF